MSQQLDRQRLEHAFQGRPDLIGAIQQAASMAISYLRHKYIGMFPLNVQFTLRDSSDAPNWIELFNEITLYVSEIRNLNAAEPPSKKRRIDEAGLPINTISNGINEKGPALAAVDNDEPVLLRVKDISLVLPQRKKYTLEFTDSHISARHPDTQDLIPGIIYAWKDIIYAFCLPVPEKAQKQHNYILFPKLSNLPTVQGSSIAEPLVFTISDAAPKPGIISGINASAASAVSDDYKSLFDWAFSRSFADSGNNVKIIKADEKHFASVLKEAHRPNEKAVFVKGFRGSKDGYLFFLTTGILWGFKKPLLFLPKELIAAVSYTSVLQRTFNLNVEVYTGGGDPKSGDSEEQKDEFEFAMLDQEDFAGIDTYIKRHGLQDASMAEQRRAKRLGINVVRGEDGQKVDVGDTGELEKAEAELQDEEDEEEEDYDPGSEGESEGEGSDTDEEDEDGDDGGDGDGAEDGAEDGEGEGEEEDYESRTEEN